MFIKIWYYGAKEAAGMYFIIMGLPFAAAFAALQFFLCKKAQKNITKLLPLFFGAVAFILAAFIRGENLIASAVYGIFGQAIFAIVVLLWIFGGAVSIGAVIGWIIYLLKNR